MLPFDWSFQALGECGSILLKLKHDLELAFTHSLGQAPLFVPIATSLVDSVTPALSGRCFLPFFLLWHVSQHCLFLRWCLYAISWTWLLPVVTQIFL